MLLSSLARSLLQDGDNDAKDAVQRARVAVKDVEQKAAKALTAARKEHSDACVAAKSDNVESKAVWASVAKFMADVSKLKAEEKAWLAALEGIERREANLASVEEEERSAMPEPQEDEDVQGLLNVILPSVDTTVKSGVDSVTLSSDRIFSSLRDISRLVEEADAVKGQVYDGYVNGGMFKGYGRMGGRGVKDTIRGLLK